MCFSVIIPTYRRSALLKRALASVFSQRLPPLEIIVINTFPQDETAALVAELSREYRPIRYFETADPGVPAARNLGATNAQGQWLAFLDSDDAWLPDKLAEQAAFITQNKHMRICQTTEKWVRNGKHISVRKKFRKISGQFFEQSLVRCMITPSSTVMQTDYFWQLGGFDPELPACEDYDLWLRLGDGEPVGLIEQDLLIRYAGHGDQLSEKYPVMDRFRLYALLKHLNNTTLTPVNQTNLHAMINLKAGVILNGMRKRKRQESRLIHFLELLSNRITVSNSDVVLCAPLLLDHNQFSD